MDVTEFARMGGKARAAKLSKERLTSIAKKAGKASGKARKLASKLKSCQSVQNSENKV